VSRDELLRLRRELLPEEPGCIFLQVGEFLPHKRHADVLGAFSLLQGSATLLFAGSGPLQADMRKLAHALGIAKRVRFLAVRGDIPALMSLADVIVLPSWREGLPRSVMEAMAMGKPVIGSNIRGTRDLLKDGRGLLFSAGDIGALAEAMQRLSEDSKERACIGIAGRQAVTANGIDKILLYHNELYDEMLAPEGNSPFPTSRTPIDQHSTGALNSIPSSY
jgi:glycosyltransferase involved in cell wall biosynthesis